MASRDLSAWEFDVVGVAADGVVDLGDFVGLGVGEQAALFSLGGGGVLFGLGGGDFLFPARW